jgi:fatty acid desaturase
MRVMGTGRNLYGPLDAELTDSSGLRFRDLRKALTPRYGRLWVQIGLGHLALCLLLIAAVQAQSLPAQIAAAILGAMAVGYAMAYVQLFFHEAAHFLLAPTRGLNDALANAFIGVWIGQDIKRYRRIHFAHHRDLGTAEDTERTYFDALTLRFMLESLLGIRTLKVLALRRRVLATAAAENAQQDPQPGSRWPLIVGLALHGCIVLGLVAYGRWGAAVAWVAGIGTVYPFLAALRQLLEHREVAGPAGPTPYAATHRLLGTGLFAATFGSAGFNRHLLHHMEPQISCTRLGELESYLMRTSRASWIDEHRMSYGDAFAALLARDRAQAESARVRSL